MLLPPVNRSSENLRTGILSFVCITSMRIATAAKPKRKCTKKDFVVYIVEREIKIKRNSDYFHLRIITFTKQRGKFFRLGNRSTMNKF